MAKYEKSITAAAEKIGNAKVADQQRKALKSFLQGNDVFVSLPTGYGKMVFFFQAAPLCVKS